MWTLFFKGWERCDIFGRAHSNTGSTEGSVVNRPPPACKMQSPLVRFIRAMLGKRTTFGHLISSFTCGIIAGSGILWEGEGQEQVAAALNDIWRRTSPPTLMFYDVACKRRRYLLTHPDWFWMSTINIVDRRLFIVLQRIVAACAGAHSEAHHDRCISTCSSLAW